MKKVLSSVMIGALLIGGVSAVSAVELSPGLQEFAISGMLDLDAPDGFALDLNTSYGYFVAKNIEIGAGIGIGATDNDLQLSVGPFAEYNMPLSEKLFFALGAHAAFLHADVDDMDLEDDYALNLKGTAALKYFINENVAITGGFALDWASSELYHSDSDELKDIATTITIGTRFYF